MLKRFLFLSLALTLSAARADAGEKVLPLSIFFSMHPQSAQKPAPGTPATDKPAPEKPAPGTPAAEPKITSVAVFPQATYTTSPGGSTQDFVLEINGTGFADITDISKVYVVVLPATGVTPSPIPVLSRSLDGSKILAQFTAPANYALEEIALSTGSNLLPFSTGTLSCDFNSKVKLIPQMVPKSQAGNKYGNGVAKNFYAVQISIVNECPMAIVVPLGGDKRGTPRSAGQH